jgi:peptide-methionine (S)-S-oxide reductase
MKRSAFILFFLLVTMVTPLLFDPARAETPVAPVEETALFSGGCFWGVEAVFRHVRGVREAVSGYAGGSASTATYEQVSTGTTGHAESVRVRFDPRIVSYRQLLDIFFTVAHDPTQLDRQGPDVGSQYRSVIFFITPAQQLEARSTIAKLAAARVYRSPIVTRLVPFDRFYPAEKHHQNFVAMHPESPYVMVNDLPKLDLLKKKYPYLYR